MWQLILDWLPLVQGSGSTVGEGRDSQQRFGEGGFSWCGSGVLRCRGVKVVCTADNLAKLEW